MCNGGQSISVEWVHRGTLVTSPISSLWTPFCVGCLSELFVCHLQMFWTWAVCKFDCTSLWNRFLFSCFPWMILFPKFFAGTLCMWPRYFEVLSFVMIWLPTRYAGRRLSWKSEFPPKSRGYCGISSLWEIACQWDCRRHVLPRLKLLQKAPRARRRLRACPWKRTGKQDEFRENGTL